MTIITTSQENTPERFSIEMICEKKEASVTFQRELGYINVLCKNACHRAWKGGGRMFWGGWDEAKAAYKSSEMRAMIEHAEEMSA